MVCRGLSPPSPGLSHVVTLPRLSTRRWEAGDPLPNSGAQPGAPSPEEDLANFQVLARILPVMLTFIPYWMVYFQVRCGVGSALSRDHRWWWVRPGPEPVEPPSRCLSDAVDVLPAGFAPPHPQHLPTQPGPCQHPPGLYGEGWSRQLCGPDGWEPGRSMKC